MRKIYLIVVILMSTFYSFAQGLTYNISSTNQIKNFKHVFTYTKGYLYDEDFQKSQNPTYSESKVLIEINSSGTGKLVILFSTGNKTTLDIYSCYKKNYNNSSSGYWEFAVENELSKNYDKTTSTYCLDIDNNTFGDFWQWFKYNKSRYYFTN
ncbi:hypothetical protein [Flavobacterium sp. XS1P27]|uniref:hypothetical protein n=1 Tax=Flavobacterium sp. XS1P27 TaxID=3401724 RepID=UPI003AAF3D04